LPSVVLGGLAVVGGVVWAVEQGNATEKQERYDANCKALLTSGQSCDSLRGDLSDAQRAQGRSDMAKFATIGAFATGVIYAGVRLAF